MTNLNENESTLPQDYQWTWVEPDAVNNMQATLLNENISCSRNNNLSMFPDVEDERFAGLLAFVRAYYDDNILHYESVEQLAIHLLSLRAIDLQIRVVKGLIKRDDMVNAAQLTLGEILGYLQENGELMARLNEILEDN